MSKISPTLLPAKPLISAASALAPSSAAGIQVGFGAPWPWVEVSLPLPRPFRFSETVMELSSVCITRPMMVFSDHRCRFTERAKLTGWAAAVSAYVSQRGARPPPGICCTESAPIALEPLP